MIFIYQIKIIRGYVFLWPGIGKKEEIAKKEERKRKKKREKKKKKERGRERKRKKGGRNLFLVFDFKSD